jgi:diadenosine tetraphosphate (Ap4A) HIT family hydrolase
MPFSLNSQLASDTILVSDDPDWLLLMMNDQQYPWFIVVPKVENASEWHDLPSELQISLHLYCVELGRAIQRQFDATKINTAALGNMVSQLHIHVIGRSSNDPAWPKPVWGCTAPVNMGKEEQSLRIEKLKQYFTIK